MKCAYHLERDAVGFCVNCGKPVCPDCRATLTGKTYCQPCADEIFAEKPQDRAVAQGRSGKLTAGGVLSIVSGAFGVLGGLLWILLAGAITLFDEEISGGANIGAIAGGIVLLILGIVAIVGGAYALKRSTWGLALAGAICSFFCSWLSPLGIAAIVLIVLTKGEFR